MKGEEVLARAVKIVEDELARIFGDMRAEASSVDPRLAELVDVVQDFTLRGGKRLRAALALAGYWGKGWGRGDAARVAKLMAGIELLQSYLLVHDDIMDKDEVRRGGPTVHVSFRESCRKAGIAADCAHYGISQAITAGDYLESAAVFNVALSCADATRIPKIIEDYARGLRLVAYGQFLDVRLSGARLSEVTEEDVLMVHRLKTSSYTVELPLRLGARASGTFSDDEVEALSGYAIPAGIAFQLRDDIIGLYGDPSVTGKPAGNDVRERKKTLLVVKAYELGGDEVRRMLDDIYGSQRPVLDSEVEGVRMAVKESGSLSYNLELIEALVEEARGELEQMSWLDPEAAGFLEWLLKALAYRER
ncbi:MAG: polyprenyl synthetase family protein [Desulfurococcaceae archaeon]